MNIFVLFSIETMYSQTCVGPPYKTRDVSGFSDRWLLISV